MLDRILSRVFGLESCARRIAEASIERENSLLWRELMHRVNFRRDAEHDPQHVRCEELRLKAKAATEDWLAEKPS